MASPIDELKTELTHCAICLCELKDPRCLPCLHSFCERCLKSSLHVFQQSSALGNKSFKCPNCRKKTQIPPDGIEGFPKDFKANKISEFLNNSEAYLNVPKCDFCKNHSRKVKIFCVNCRKHYCERCEDIKHNIAAFDDHVTILIGVIDTPNTTKCDLHPSECVSHFCKSCSSQICLICLFKTHKDHDVVEIHKELSLLENGSKDQLYNLQNVILDLQKNVYKLSSTGKHLMSGYGSCKEKVQTQSRRLQNIILENERKHLVEVDQFFTQTFSKLLHERDQQKQLLLASENLLMKTYSMLLHGEKNASVEELQKFEKEIKSMRHLCEEINELQDEGIGKQIDFIPVDNLAIGNISELNVTNNGINARMPEMNMLGATEVTIEDMFEILPDIIEDDENSLNSLELLKPMSLTEILEKSVDENKSSTGHPSSLTRKNNTATGRTVNKKFTEILGKSVDGNKSLTGRTSSVVRKPNTSSGSTANSKVAEIWKLTDEKQFDKQTEKSNNDKSELNNCRTIPQQETDKSNIEKTCSFKSNKELSTLTKSPLNKPLKTKHISTDKVHVRLKTVINQRGKGQGQLLKPFSVCYNMQGEVVVGELGNRRIQVFDIKGNLKQILAPGHVNPQCVVAMDTNTYAVVDELTKSIKLVSADSDIKTVENKVSFPHALCLSPDQTFIVSDSVFDSIYKISMDGEKISQYSYHGNSLNDLDNPSALYVTDNQTVFVTDTGNHQVKFLDNNLNLMYKFGCYGNSDGQLRYPRGITGTKDVLFISDSGNNRIVMFSHSGKYQGCLLDEESGIINPAGICFNKQDSTLCVVLPDSDQVRIYEVKLNALKSS